MSGRQVVHRVEDGVDRRTIAATTYQMRNCFQQLRDGFFTSDDVMNYVQHHQAAVLAARLGAKHPLEVLDVCCGRGLMLPFLRYHASPQVAGYTGVDLAPENATWLTRRVQDGKPLAEVRGAEGSTDEERRGSYYAWPTRFVESNVATMADPVKVAGVPPVGFAIYTAAIEHMHLEDGRESLVQTRRLMRPGGYLLLTTPLRPPDEDGFSTTKRAHVYEWSLAEVTDGLDAAGWVVQDSWPLVMGRRAILAEAERMGGDGLVGVVNRIFAHVPAAHVQSVLAPAFRTEAGTEVAFLARTDES